MQQHLYYREHTAIPIDTAINTIQKLSYASIERAGLILLFLTGARVSELDNMKITNIYNNQLFWRVGKNQNGKPRTVDLPLSFMEELANMRLKYGAKERILPVKSDSFRRLITKLRPMMGVEWLERTPIPKGGRVNREYKLQLKGFRKLYSTKLFAEKMAEWGSADIGLMFASKELRHSTTKMTATYYLVEDFNKVGINKYLNKKMSDILYQRKQRTLIEFGI